MKRSPSLRLIVLWMSSLMILVVSIVGFAVWQNIYRDEVAYYDDISERVEIALVNTKEKMMLTNTYLISLLTENDNIRIAASSHDAIQRDYALRNLRNEIDLQMRFMPIRFGYMYYNTSGAASYWQVSAEDGQNTVYLIRRFFETGIFDQTLEFNTQKWEYTQLGDSLCFYQSFYTSRGFMFAWVDADDLFSSISDIIPGSNGFFTLVEDQATLYSSVIGNQAHSDETRNAKRSYQSTMLTPALITTLYPLSEYSSMKMLLSVILPVLLLVFGFSIYSIFYFSQYVAKPLSQFKEQMASYDKLTASKPRHGFSELNEAMDGFQAVTKQLERLKISSYEDKLALVKTRLDYYQLQIKPHFFINCFGIIFHMAENEEFDTIQQFCMTLMNYVRYLFKDSFSLVPISDELRMINDYLYIQKIRRNQETSFTITLPEKLNDFPIPPLSILTFVENSIKHTDNLAALEIRIQIKKVDDSAEITISDNGPGIEGQVREQLNHNVLPSAQSQNNDIVDQHIGIQNIAKRLFLIYGDNYHLLFKDCSMGTVVYLRIPDTTAKAKENPYTLIQDQMTGVSQ